LVSGFHRLPASETPLSKCNYNLRFKLGLGV
jgi:hypothetical protein